MQRNNSNASGISEIGIWPLNQKHKAESVLDGRREEAASALLKRLNWSVVLGLPATTVHWFRALLHWKHAAQLLCVSPGWFAEP